MKYPWFKRGGWFYYPVSVPGGVFTALPVAFCVQVFLAINGRSHSVSDTLYGVFPYFTCAFMLWDWLAGRTSARAD